MAIDDAAGAEKPGALVVAKRVGAETRLSGDFDDGEAEVA